MEITLPHNWRPRDYQIPMWRYMEHGGRRSVLLWHRRAGKDDNSLRYLASAAMEKTATYWYLLPKAVQVRRAIWEAVNPHTGKRRVIEAFPDAIVARTRDNEMTLTLANGSSVHFLGADNFDTLVGSPPYGIVFSEYSLTNPLSWAYLKPILEENGGWAIFNFTSRGRNHAATLYEYAAGEESWFAQRLPVTETSVFTPEQVEEIRKEMHRTYGEEDGEALFRQEYMCDLDAPVVGAYYGKLLARAADEGRVTGVPYDPAAPVFTAWDLGMDDSTAIWVAQCVGREIHIIDYYEANGQPLAHYADWVRGRGYGRPTHYLPHDARARELGTGKSREEVLAGLDIGPVLVVPQQSVADGINAVRTILPRCWFDQIKCGAGAEALRNYRKEYDEKRKVFHDRPLHDWTSHAADAFRYLALSCGQHQKSGSKGFRPRRR